MKRTRSAGPDEPSEAAPVSTSGTELHPELDELELELSLQVKWTSVSGGTEDGPGKTRITRLVLKQLEDVDKLGKHIPLLFSRADALVLLEGPEVGFLTHLPPPMQVACQKASWTVRTPPSHGRIISQMTHFIDGHRTRRGKSSPAMTHSVLHHEPCSPLAR